MFLVFNKEKIYTYIISVLTVCVLLFIASNNNNTVETSSKVNKNIPNIITQNNITNTGNN